MKLVVIESPYSGDIVRNTAYARAAMADCLARGEAPIASHLLYTQPGVLDDTNPIERELGMRAGFLWGAHASLVVAYTDLGVSGGMLEGIRHYLSLGLPYEERKLGPGWQIYGGL